MPAPSVNEGQSAWLRVRPLDPAGQPSPANSFEYRIDCMTTGTSVRARTVVASPGADFELELTPADNAIVVPANQQEYRRVTCSVVDVNGKVTLAEFDYVVNNLRYAPIAAPN